MLDKISLIVTVISSIVLFWESDTLGYIFLAIGAFLAYGLDFSIKFLFGQDGAKVGGGFVAKGVEAAQALGFVQMGQIFDQEIVRKLHG